MFLKKSIASLYFLILGLFQLLLGSSINSKKLRDYLIGIPVFPNNNYFYLKNIYNNTVKYCSSNLSNQSFFNHRCLRIGPPTPPHIPYNGDIRPIKHFRIWSYTCRRKKVPFCPINGQTLARHLKVFGQRPEVIVISGI